MDPIPFNLHHHDRRSLVTRGRGIVFACIFVFCVAGCPPPLPPAAVTPASLPLIVGMEYAFPGLAHDMAAMRLPGVKFMPDIIGWEQMQPSENAPINFAMLDRLVNEYQEAGTQECMIGLKSESAWASVAPKQPLPETNFAPKPEFVDDYAAWVGVVIERYDGDGVDDMPNLEHPIRYFEIGVEFSTYEPEPVADYLAMLEAGYQAAHTASAEAVVMHAAFLPATAFVNNPGPEDYEAAFAGVSARIMYHSLADMRAVLDRPDLFDAVNVHLASGEVEATAAWLRYEMRQRGYEYPIIVSDTAPTPLIGWGAADVCNLAPERMGLVIPPATEADRCRLASFFALLLDGDQPTVDWVHGFAAEDMTKLVMRAAASKIAFINTSFMEDLYPLNLPVFHASAGITPWGGMVASTLNFFTQEHTVTGYRPLFYALQQMAGRLDGYESIERMATDNPAVVLFDAQSTSGPALPAFWIAWYEPGFLVLPGDAVPSISYVFMHGGAKLTIETLITEPGQTVPATQTVDTPTGAVELILTPTPVFLLASQ